MIYNPYIEAGLRPKRSYKKYIISIVLLLFASLFIFKFGLAYRKITINNNVLENNDKIGGIFELGEITPDDVIKSEILPIPKKDENRLNILVLGVRGEDDLANGGLLTDTILVLSLNKNTGKSAMISIPRDLFINMKNIFVGKVNGVYWTGLQLGKSFGYTKDTFSRITGVYIDQVVVFDFNSFTSIVDTLGGINITLDKPFNESLQWGYEFNLPEGENHLDSEQALYYARSRYNTNDFDRARRQQEIIMAIKNKLLSLGVLGNPVKLNNLISNVSESVNTDIGIWDIKDLIDLASSINATNNDPKKYVIDTTNILYQTTAFNAYILLPNFNDPREVQKVFQNIFK